MTNFVLPPVFTPQFFYANGQPLAGGLLYSYQAGTSTPTATYTDSTGGTQNTNPIVLNGRGECSLWMPINTFLKFVLADPSGNVIWTRDQCSALQLLSLWGGTDVGAANIYILNYSATFQSYVNGTVIYFLPANTNTGASTLNVNGLGVIPIVTVTGAPITAGQIVQNIVAEVIYVNGSFQLVSVSSFTGVGVGTFGAEQPISSAATTDLGTLPAHVGLITGTTTISSFGSSASFAAPIYVIRFAGALTLTYSSNLILPGAGNIMTSAGDAALAEYLGAGVWKILIYQFSTGGAQNTKIKAADTVINNNATLMADPDLQTSVLAIGRYSYEVYLIFDSVTAGDGFKWTNDGTAVDSRGISPALAYGFVNGAAYGPKSETPYGTTITYATVGTGANSNAVMYKGSLLVGTVGTFGVSWAQVSATAAATTLRAGSYLTLSLVNTGSSNSSISHIYTSGTALETFPSGYNTLTIEGWGGTGGGGGGYYNSGSGQSGGGGGGASGSYFRHVISVTGLGGDTLNYSVGAAGTPGAGNGGPGSVSTVTSGTLVIPTLTAPAGLGGQGATAPLGGAGGAPGGVATGANTVNQNGNSGAVGNFSAAGAGGAPISGVNTGGFAGGKGGYSAITNPPGASGNTGVIAFTYS